MLLLLGKFCTDLHFFIFRLARLTSVDLFTDLKS
jgi:hypothetical protein